MAYRRQFTITSSLLSQVSVLASTAIEGNLLTLAQVLEAGLVEVDSKKTGRYTLRKP